MARVLALVEDLMLASRVDGSLSAAGHEVTVAPAAGPDAAAHDLIVADLDLVEPADVARIGPPTIGFYSHVDIATRRAAEAAGFTLVVPRSRMARELPDLAARLLAGEGRDRARANPSE